MLRSPRAIPGNGEPGCAAPCTGEKVGGDGRAPRPGPADPILGVSGQEGNFFRGTLPGRSSFSLREAAVPAASRTCVGVQWVAVSPGSSPPRCLYFWGAWRVSPRVCGGFGSASSAWAQAGFAKVWSCQGAQHEPNGWAVELCPWALLCCQAVGVLSTP